MKIPNHNPNQKVASSTLTKVPISLDSIHNIKKTDLGSHLFALNRIRETKAFVEKP